MKNWPHLVIEELLENYAEGPSDLSRFSDEKLITEADEITKAQKLRCYLETFEKMGYLTWQVGKRDKPDIPYTFLDEYKNNFSKDIHGIIETVKNNRVEGHLTIPGFDYAISIRRSKESHESNLRANKSVTNFNRYTKWISFFALIISVIAIVKKEKAAKVVIPEKLKIDQLSLPTLDSLSKYFRKIDSLFERGIIVFPKKAASK